jgi:hypothetical protein
LCHFVRLMLLAPAAIVFLCLRMFDHSKGWP